MDEPLAGQRVVREKVARLGTALGDASRQFLGRGLCDVLFEPATIGPCDQDSFDSGVVDGAVGERVREGLEQIGGVIALAQSKDLAGVVAGRARLVFFQGCEECGRRAAQVAEGAAQVVQIGAAVGVWRSMTGQDRALLGAARLELVACDAGQVGLVDKELVDGDAHGENLGNVFVRQ